MRHMRVPKSRVLTCDTCVCTHMRHKAEYSHATHASTYTTFSINPLQVRTCEHKPTVPKHSTKPQYESSSLYVCIYIYIHTHTHTHTHIRTNMRVRRVGTCVFLSTKMRDMSKERVPRQRCATFLDRVRAQCIRPSSPHV